MERERTDRRERESQHEAEHEAIAETADAQQALAPRGGGRGEIARRARIDRVSEWTPLLAGQGAGLIRREQPAADIVRDLVAKMATVRAGLTG